MAKSKRTTMEHYQQAATVLRTTLRLGEIGLRHGDLRSALDVVREAVVDLRRVAERTEANLGGPEPRLAGPALLVSLARIQRDLRAGGVRVREVGEW